jgi:hypothetical protein
MWRLDVKPSRLTLRDLRNRLGIASSLFRSSSDTSPASASLPSPYIEVGKVMIGSGVFVLSEIFSTNLLTLIGRNDFRDVEVSSVRMLAFLRRK